VGSRPSAHRALTGLLALIAVVTFAPAAVAKPPAPGAPGDKHAWSSADKHGFGTAHQLRSNVWSRCVMRT
jgi:hypothetical protein